MSSPADAPSVVTFDPTQFSTFRFLERSIDADGTVRLAYGLDDAYRFEERFILPMPEEPVDLELPEIQRLLQLLHLCAGVSYYKTAIPPAVEIQGTAPGPHTARMLEALYSEGLGEFAVVNGLEHLPRPQFPSADVPRGTSPAKVLDRVLVPVGGGKDSAVAIEIARASGLETALFSVGRAGAIQATVAAAGLPWLQATRQIDRTVIELNAQGALNGHVPITAIVTSVALLTAALHGYDAVTLANERSASAGNTMLDGVEVNHQFSKSFRAEQLMHAAVWEADDGAPMVFSVLRAASELSIARTFSRFTQYHPAFTSCNRIFKIDEAQRLSSWCCDCDKCRFVFLILAPFMSPEQLETIFGKAMLDDPTQYEGFALLTATGGHKPFECVGEVRDSVAALRLLQRDPQWAEHSQLQRLLTEVLPLFTATEGRPADVFALSDEHLIPGALAVKMDALLSA